MKSWIGRFVFFQLLCRVDLVSDHVAPWRGDLKSGGLRLGSTPKLQPSKHLKLNTSLLSTSLKVIFATSICTMYDKISN